MGMKARANVATFFKYFVLILMGFIMVYPLLWMVGSTFKTNAEIFTSLSPFTAHPTLDGYYNAVTKTYGGDITIWRAFLNTYSYVIPKVVFTVISSVIAAYGFSRFKFKGRDFLFGVMIMTLFLPQVVLNVPQYMMYNKFDWINNPLYPALWPGQDPVQDHLPHAQPLSGRLCAVPVHVELQRLYGSPALRYYPAQIPHGNLC